MSANVNLRDLMGHTDTLKNPEPTIDNMSRILNAIQSPTTLNREVFKGTNFSDWRQSVIRVRDHYQSTVGQNVDSNLKLEIQSQMRRDQELAARQSYLDVLSTVSEKIASERRSLLTEIKAKKFPLYSARAKTINSMGIVTIHPSPDMQARTAGASELLIASQTPLKYITGILLENFAAAGRIDLVSALIERAMLNQGELQGRQYQDIYNVGLEHYDQLGVQPDRQLYKQVRGIERHLLPTVSTSMDWDSMRVMTAGQAYQEELRNDNLLEL
jgi:hypothetical protein